jgi:RHS repeat-associated protein
MASAQRLTAQAPLADTQRGFPPNTGIATSGLDHVNLFNGNVAITLPLGLDYPIGPGLSSQLRLVYNSQIWRTEPVCSDLNNNEYSGVFVRGSPVLGAGWRLDFGYIHVEPESGDSDFLSPDGAGHRLAPSPSPPHTTDATFLRQPQPSELDFPSGDRAFLTQTISVAQVAHGATTHDFNDADGTYVTKTQNRYGDYALVTFQADYEVSDGGKVRIKDIKHYRRNVASGTDELVRTITFHYQALTVNPGGSPSNTWTVMSGIDLPTASGTQHISFSYHTSGFFRPTSDTTASTCLQGGSQSLVAAPLLKSVQLDTTLPTLKYAFEYLTDFGSASNARTGAMSQMTLPTGGAIAYQWELPQGNQPIAAPGSGCQVGDPTCDVGFRRKNVAALAQRTEYPHGLTGPANTWTYGYQRSTSPPFNKITEVTAPDGYKVRHYFNNEPDSTAFRPSNGLEYQVEHLDAGGMTVTRRVRFCFEDDLGHSDVCDLASLSPLSGNIRQSLSDTTTMTSGGSPVQTRRVERSGWNGYGHFGTEDLYDWDNTTLKRKVETVWDANSSDWLLELFTRRTVTKAGVLLRKYFEFDDSNGFLKGEITWDSTNLRVFAHCRYPEKPLGPTGPTYGNLFQEFTATADYPIEPPSTLCTDVYLDFPNDNSVGMNNDAFGKQHEYQNGALISSRWMTNNNPATLGWYAARFTRDNNSGLVTASFDTAGLATGYSYDLLGRVMQTSPPGEAAVSVSYDLPTQTTLTRNGGTGLSTWERQIYDGFGRLTREIRQLPTPGTPPSPAYAVRVHRYDSVGRKSFDSEWAGCTDANACAANAVTQGTTYSAFDPFGRPQSIVAADGATTAISYADGTVPSSDTLKRVTVNNLNGTCGTSCTGGTAATTAYRYDVLGRLVSVTEPNGVDVTSYTYDVNDKVTSVQQVPQQRTFTYDSFGFLRIETTPEKGTVTFKGIGSLGNVRERNEPGGVKVCSLYDAGGRVTSQTAGIQLPTDATCTSPGLVPFLTNCYDGGGTCPGGTSPGGKLTRRIGYNPFSPNQSSVTESFTYSGVGGRLSSKGTTVSGVPLGFGAVTESWIYNLLGLPSTHTLPKLATDSAVTANMQYSNGIPIGMSITSGPSIVSNATYHPYGGVASWKAANNITTTIAADAALLPRPASISSSSGGFSTGAFTYDGAGNITKMNPDTFTYDDRSRLIASTVSGTPLSYQYDRFGNLNYTSVDPANNRLKAGTYDPRGNLTALSGQRFEYDTLSRQATFNGGFERYLYDGAGERIARITGSTPGASFFTVTPCRVLDTRNEPPNPPVPLNSASPRIVQVAGACGIPLDAAAVSGNLTVVTPPDIGYLQLYPAGASINATTLNYKTGLTRSNNFNLGLSGGGQLALAVSAAPTHAIIDVSGYYAFPAATWTLSFRDESNRIATDYTVTSSLISRSKNYFYFGNLLTATRDASGSYLYYSSDHLGTPRLVTNASATTIETHKYQPFGQEIAGSFGSQPLKFASMERDISSGKDYDHARFLSPVEGRFLTPDIVGRRPADPQTWNRYTYARDNPLKFADPNGLDFTLAPGLSRQEARFIRNAFVGLVRRSSGRSLFQRLEADPRRIVVGISNLNDPSDIRTARFMRTAVNLTFGETTFRSPATGTVNMMLDIGAIKEFARRTQGAIDPTGITTSAHEMFHVNAGLNSDVSTFRAGDFPTSATGPAQQFGEAVYGERADISKRDAGAIVDAALTQDQAAVDSLNEFQRASCFFSGLCDPRRR